MRGNGGVCVWCRGPKEDIWVAVAGPLTHIPMCLFWYALVGLMVMGPFGVSGKARP